MRVVDARAEQRSNRMKTKIRELRKARKLSQEELLLGEYELLELIGKKRGMLIRGGETDTERAAVMLLDEYRGGKLGKLSFERPGE